MVGIAIFLVGAAGVAMLVLAVIFGLRKIELGNMGLGYSAPVRGR